MTFGLYIKQSAIIYALIILLAYLIGLFVDDEHVTDLYLLASLGFFLFNTCMYLYAEKVSRTTSLYSFNSVIVASFLFKLVLSIIFLYLWNRAFRPTTGVHILHYFVTYIVFTTHEVYFLTILAKNSPTPRVRLNSEYDSEE